MGNAAVDQIEENLLSDEVSDEAVEATGYATKGLGHAITLSFCSGLDTCPA
jgi:hypothetical protein